MKLDYNDLCSNESGIDYMVIVIVVEVILLIIIVFKLAYDVQHYNKTGELPWLARHICLGYSYSGIKSGKTYSNENNQNVDWNNHVDEQGGCKDDDMEQGNLFLRCFYKSRSIKSESTQSRNGGLFGLQDSVTFRPRRHTNSTLQSSSKLGNSNLNVVRSPMQLTTSNIQMTTTRGNSSNEAVAAAVDLIERCSSPRSAKSSSPSSNELKPMIGPRSKKISIHEERAFRKDVLDPYFPEDDYDGESNQQPLIHRSSEDEPNIGKSRKISRLQKSLTTSSGSLDAVGVAL
jgi:hypothetical protein